jgi:hypothetical protein
MDIARLFECVTNLSIANIWGFLFPCLGSMMGVFLAYVIITPFVEMQKQYNSRQLFYLAKLTGAVVALTKKVTDINLSASEHTQDLSASEHTQEMSDDDSLDSQ